MMHRFITWVPGLALPVLALIALVGLVQTASAQDRQARPEPINLGASEAYRRDGTLVDMKTCLAVADDRQVPPLLDHPQLIDVLDLPPIEQAATLRRMPKAAYVEGLSIPRDVERVQVSPGFGTLLACAQIVASWYSRTLLADGDDGLSAAVSPRRSQDGRIEHGALVIDLAVDEGLRAFIEPVPLTRLLTSPGLVPPSAYGGIVVKNAVVNRTLTLNDLRLTNPIAFINVKFAGRGVSMELFDIEDPMPPTALTISSARLDDHLMFKDSAFCGDIVIEESRFEETLTFRNVDQHPIGCRRPPDAESAISLEVRDSQFAQSLSLIRSRFAAAAITGVSADNLVADRVDFGRRLAIVESDLGSLELACSILARHAEIARNKIDKHLSVEGVDSRKIRGDIDTTCGDWWRRHGRQGPTPSRLGIRDNRIGGGLNLRHFTGNALISPLRLPSNQVGGRSQIVMPGPTADGSVWAGQVDFQGSTYDSVLEISRSREPASATSDNVDETGYCPEIVRAGKAVDAPEFRGIDIQLRAMRVRTLLWNLPLDCAHRWLGYGLTYDLWLKGEYARQTLDATASASEVSLDHYALKVWRKTLKRYDSPSLSAMSRYMAGNGHYVDSRRVLLEAKRLNYAPTCSPDQWTAGCFIAVGAEHLWPAMASALLPVETAKAEEGAAGAAVAGSSESSVWTAIRTTFEWLWRLAMLFLLWPGGYGAEPERAMVLLAAFFALCWLVYAVYVGNMRRQIATTWSAASRFVDEQRERRTSASETMTTPSAPGLPEAAGIYAPHPASAGQTASDEADDKPRNRATASAMSDDDKLREIQGPLLAAIKSWEEDAEGIDLMELKALRRDLERFGNTEIPGFGRFDINKMPTRFTTYRYSFDTMLPVIDLHAYSNYYPLAPGIRALSVAQHVCGWWWLTVFIASAAIL